MNSLPERHQRAHLTASAEVDAAGADAAGADATGAFEILAITAGEGNGWHFSADCLRASLALWDGAECFVDHRLPANSRGAGRSVRDLAGVLSDPRWDDARQGVRCKLNVVGPSGPLLAELGRQLLAEPGMALAAGDQPADRESTVPADTSVGPGEPRRVSRTPRVGFSADIIFNAQGQVVKKILRVLSVDLVFNPARGGAFMRALNSLNGGFAMFEDTMHEDGAGVENTEAQDVNGPFGAAQQTRTSQPVVQANQSFQAQMCAYLLETGLAASRLPSAVQARLRQQFAGQVFEPAALNRAIDDARQLVSAISGPAAVQGTAGGRVHGMLSSEDQFSAAVYDLLGVERPAALAAARLAKLSGIRELYTLMTGDREFIGGYHPDRAQFATSADLPGVLKNALNKLIAAEWQELGRSGYRWWEPVVSVEHFTNLHDITGVLVGEVTVLPQVNEGAAYAALPVKDSAETASWTKYGGYIGLTLEMFERDQTHKLRQYPRKLASAGLRRISALVANVFTANSGTGPAMADSANVFAAGHANLGSTALSATSWEAASKAIYEQPMLVGTDGTAPLLAVDARYLIVPRALRLTGMQILYPDMEHNANIFSENMQKGQMGDVITCPEFSDANNWAAAADPRLAPGIILAERFGVMPEIIMAANDHQGALFTNDEIRMKARHWLAVVVADYRPLYKANVA